eukprot:Platyproteum_vivax@DN5213_c0_g1_i3.p1
MEDIIRSNKLQVGAATLDFDMLATLSLREDLGTACRLWESGLLTAKYLEFCFDAGAFEWKNALELGAGLSPAGTTAAYLGATVTATDTACVIENLTKLVLERNSDLLKGNFSVKEVDWTGDPPGDIDYQMLDLILASDVVFNEKNCTLFIQFLQKLLPKLRKDVTLLISHKHRNDMIDKRFVDALSAMNLTGYEEDQDGFLARPLKPACKCISLWNLRKEEESN